MYGRMTGYFMVNEDLKTHHRNVVGNIQITLKYLVIGTAYLIISDD